MWRGLAHRRFGLSDPMKNRPVVQESVESVVDTLRSLIVEAEKLIQEGAAAPADEVLEDLRARYESARDQASEMLTNARRKVVAGAHQADQTIRHHPYESLAIALGVGVLLGALIRRQ